MGVSRCDLGLLVVTREGDRTSVNPQKAGARGALAFGGIGVVLWTLVVAVQAATKNASIPATLLPLLGAPLLAVLGWVYKGPAPTFMLEARLGTLRFGSRGEVDSIPVADIAGFETEFERASAIPGGNPVECYRPVIRKKDGGTIRLMPGVLTLGRKLSDLLCLCLRRSILEGGDPGEIPALPLVEPRFLVACALGVAFSVGMYFLLRR